MQSTRKLVALLVVMLAVLATGTGACRPGGKRTASACSHPRRTPTATRTANGTSGSSSGGWLYPHRRTPCWTTPVRTAPWASPARSGTSTGHDGRRRYPGLHGARRQGAPHRAGSGSVRPRKETATPSRHCAAAPSIGSVTEADVTVDGVHLTNLLTRYRFTTPLFTFAYPADNVLGVPGPGTTKSVADGLLVMLAPLAAGRHALDLRFRSGPPTRGPETSRTTSRFAAEQRVSGATHRPPQGLAHRLPVPGPGARIPQRPAGQVA